jgi:AAA domain-containing protein
MERLFVVISGLPASGKTTLARRLAPALNLPLIDKDDILDRLFESRGIGDATWRRALSRESDVVLQREAETSNGAVVVSFWRVPGMPPDSGTPTEWLRELSTALVNLHCHCAPDIAADRFCRRQRHPGHLDGQSSYADILASLHSLTGEPLPDIPRRVDVDTSRPLRLEDVVGAIRAASHGG